ncbi:hypothetical protein [Winogradskyella sp. UBA3174]|uniref:hypothetical protein n=1 Tax=Winogradskyella sp. UBA3174 TaxID=1947785 RepID=UPI0025DB3026|nr:hypothetical protein [Winogradskyella sp. UBA3174]|tara:strand:+ start:59730 stop:60218 length:489 start_codon:yes stop_codon:yes gene_type:complete
MKKILILLLVINSYSCNDNKTSKPQSEIINTNKPLIPFEDIVTDYKTWWSYHYYKINLTLDFIAIGENDNKITKDLFLQKLTTGKHITIELKYEDDFTYYKLFKLPEDIDKPIVATIKSTSSVIYEHFKMEGLVFPNFKAQGLNGTIHNIETLKGKTTVLKT